MVFSSLEFLFLFLPCALILIYTAPKRLKNAAILFVSLVFYAWGGLSHLPLMLFVIGADFALALILERCEKRGRKRIILALAVALNLFLLFFFKYADPLLSLIPSAPLLGLSLPIGISFYIFQALSYVIDVYNGDTAAQKDPVTFGAYVTLFPQLIAGPIVKYREIEDSLLSPHRPKAFAVASGIRTFVCGLAKKVLLANTAGELFDTVRALSELDRTALISWFGILLYAFHIYFDFSGYSDMAIGLGKLLGFRFPENFYYPYTSKSVSEFWRRWHITLSSWFREYLYIPLGGSRSGTAKTYRNLLFVWLFTGLWHGATPNFLFWGIYYFVLLAAERAFLFRCLSRLPAFFSRIYTAICVLFGWLIFAFDSAPEGISYLKGLFGAFGAATGTDIYDVLRNALFLAVCAVACTPLPKRLFYRFYEKNRLSPAVSFALCATGFFLCTVYLVNSSYNPFLYFRF